MEIRGKGTGEAASAQAVSVHLHPLFTRLLNERVRHTPRSSAHSSRQRSLIIDDSPIGDMEVDEDVNSDEVVDEREISDSYFVVEKEGNRYRHQGRCTDDSCPFVVVNVRKLWHRT